MSLDRQEKALREFKQIIADLVHLLRASTGSQLAYMCWVNQSRQQFVWETHSTRLSNVMFKDRVNFHHHFLDDYKELDELIKLRIGEDISKAKLGHYFSVVHAKSMLIIPFINKGETVGLTVLESDQDLDEESLLDAIYSYNNAMVNVLDTYLEVVDLHEQQKEWEEYEESLANVHSRLNKVEVITTCLDEMQFLLPNGGVSFLCAAMDHWTLALNAKFAKNAPYVGLGVDDKSSVRDALERGIPVFNMHFNSNPKLVSAYESRTEGASYVLPLLVHDRRQGAFIAYDKDPLSFKESTKHKLANLARVAALQLQSNTRKSTMDEDIFTEKYEALVTELWEKSVEHELYRLRTEPERHTWMGLVTLEDLSSFRTRFRMEELQRMQRDIVRFLNPYRFQQKGYIGFQSDYVYSFMLQSNKESALEEWVEQTRSKVAHGLKLSSGMNITVSFKFGAVKLNAEYPNAYEVLSLAKQQLAEVVKAEQEHLQVY